MAGCGCTDPGTSPTLLTLSDANPVFTQGDPSRVANGLWLQAAFPNPPCTSPTTLTFEWWEVNVSSVWRYWNSTSSPIGYNGPFQATVANFPSGALGPTNWFPKEDGVFRIRVLRNCNVAFASTYFQFTAVGYTKTRMLMTKAGVI